MLAGGRCNDLVRTPSNRLKTRPCWATAVLCFRTGQNVCLRLTARGVKSALGSPLHLRLQIGQQPGVRDKARGEGLACGGASTCSATGRKRFASVRAAPKAGNNAAPALVCKAACTCGLPALALNALPR